MYGTMSRMVKTTVYLTPALKARLARMSEDTERSEAELIRSAIEKLTETIRPRPRFGIFKGGDPITDWDEALRGFGE